MDLSNYLKKNDLYNQIDSDLISQPRIEIFEINLLPSMDKIIPFVDDSYTFTRKNLADFKKINDYFHLDEMLASDIEQKFTENFSNILEESVNIKYSNMEKIMNNMDSRYQENINLDKLRDKNLTNSEILKFQSMCGFCVLYSLGDRKLDSKQAYGVALNDLCLDIRAYNSMKSKSNVLSK